MSHDPSKVLMGATTKSNRTVVSVKSATIHPAGTIVFQKNDGTYTKDAADGAAFGVSLGRDLSNYGHMAVCKAGLGVPVLLDAGATPAKGVPVYAKKQAGTATEAADGANNTLLNATFQSGKLNAIYEDGTEGANKVAVIDFIGGL